MTRPRLAAAAVAVLLLAGCGDELAAPTTAPAVSPSATPTTTTTTTSPSPSPSPSPSVSPSRTMTRKQACQQVVEGATDWIYLISRVSKDPSLESVDSSELQSLSTKISETLPYLDDRTADYARKLVTPLDELYNVMTTGTNENIRLEEGRDAVPLVMKGCRGKASLKNYDSPYDR